VRARRAPELEDDAEEALEEPHGAAEAEEQTPRDVAREPARLVAVLAHPRRAPDDPAKQAVAQARVNARRVARRERRQEVGRRAERVVLVAVLDVDEAFAVEEPGTELDACGEVVRRPLRRAREHLAEVALHAVPVELDVVIAVDERERM